MSYEFEQQPYSDYVSMIQQQQQKQSMPPHLQSPQRTLNPQHSAQYPLVYSRTMSSPRFENPRFPSSQQIPYQIQPNTLPIEAVQSESRGNPKYAMDNFRVPDTHQPQFQDRQSDPMILRNLKYRNHVEEILQDQRESMLSRGSNNRIPFSPPQYFQDANHPKNRTELILSQNPRSSQLKPNLSGNIPTGRSILGYMPFPPPNRPSTLNHQQQLLEPQQTMQQQHRSKSVIMNQQLSFPEPPVQQHQLSFDYDRILNQNGKFLVNTDELPWNSKSEQYQSQLLEWNVTGDEYIQCSLRDFKGVTTPFYLQSRIFREARPIEKIKREVVALADGSIMPYETVIDRRLVEVLHQRDYLVYPQYIPRDYDAARGTEQINDVFTYDRSFIVQQDPTTKTEIMHEYSTSFTSNQLCDFILQSGIQVNSLKQQFGPVIQHNEISQQLPPAAVTSKPIIQAKKMIEQQRISEQPQIQRQPQQQQQQQSRVFLSYPSNHKSVSFERLD